jgi:trehalose synthase
MDDRDENALIVNALQRHSAIVIQKSLEEGFGLTVTEAMWKARPVIASARGGIKEQISSGFNGVLVEPDDYNGVATAIASLLADPPFAAEMGRRARERVRSQFMAFHTLVRYARLLVQVEDGHLAGGHILDLSGEHGSRR